MAVWCVCDLVGAVGFCRLTLCGVVGLLVSVVYGY